MPRVKVCGNRSKKDLDISLRMGADAVGFIVGVRHRTEDAIAPELAAELLRSVPVFVTPVLVTHLITAAEVLDLYRWVPTAAIQLHDDIPPDQTLVLRERLPHVALIKAIGIVDESSIDAARHVEPLVDALLLDSHAHDRIGGTGQVHDWSISRRIVEAARVPVILAGGLTPENVGAAIDAVRPYGVDANSGLEFPDGNKDPARVHDYITRVKSHDVGQAS
jgi:phosphoribosylanthranilate isomerase